MNFQSCCTIQNPENKKSPCSLSLSLADRQDPHVSDTERERGGATDSGRPKRTGGETPARRTAPEQSTPLRNLSHPTEQQQAHRRKLHAGHGGHGHGGETLSDDWAPTGKMNELTSNKMTRGS